MPARPAPPLWDIARREPTGTALEDAGSSRTWAEVESRTNALGRGIESLGLAPGDHVAVIGSNRSELVEALLGAMRAGLVVTPVKTNWTIEEVGHLLEDADTKLVVTDIEVARGAAAARGVPVLDLDTGPGGGSRSGSGGGFEAWLTCQSDAPLPADRAGWRMSYTSGTTGRPKGVVHATSGTRPFIDAFAGNAAVAAQLRIPREGAHLVVSRLFHGAPLTFALAALAQGTPLRILDRWEPEHALDALERDVASTVMVPTMFRQLLALDPARRAGFTAVSSLVTAVHGGEPCPRELRARMEDWWGPIFVEYFGFTEGGMTIVGPEEAAARPGTVGRAVTGDIRILDEAGRPLAPGQEGRVFFAAPGGGPGFSYRNDPDKTQRAYVDGAYTAGDIGWVDDDGYLFISGRAAEVIVTSGVNVYPAEVEAVVGAVDGVGDVCVVGGPDDERGEQVVAFVALAPGAHAAAVVEGVDAAGRERLAGYKRPRQVVVRADIPRDPTGKLLRRVLRDELWAGRTAFAARRP